jgi:hypothetical protein
MRENPDRDVERPLQRKDAPRGHGSAPGEPTASERSGVPRFTLRSAADAIETAAVIAKRLAASPYVLRGMSSRDRKRVTAALAVFAELHIALQPAKAE